MSTPDPMQFRELLLQALTHERGGTLVYSTALECVVDDTLRSEWEEFLAQTLRHVDLLTEVCVAMGLDPDEVTPGCRIVQHTGKALVIAMKMARADGTAWDAQRVACDCVVLAETKDHANWALLGQCAARMEGDGADVLQQACDEVEGQEVEHLQRSKAWSSALWLDSLGLPAGVASSADAGQGAPAGVATDTETGRRQGVVKSRAPQEARGRRSR